MRTAKSNYIRETAPDAKFGSVTIAKLINYVMVDGKRSVAQKQVYQALDTLATELKMAAPEVLDRVLRSVSPEMEVRSRRVGGAAYQVPMPVRPKRSFALGLRWVVQEARKRSNRDFHTFADKLVAEMRDALSEQGGAIERKRTSHRMAEANKAFAHFRW